MLSDKKVVCPINLLEKASGKKGIKAAIVNAGKPLPMLAVLDAVNEKLIEPIFIGDKMKYKNVLMIYNGIFQIMKLFMNL